MPQQKGAAWVMVELKRPPRGVDAYLDRQGECACDERALERFGRLGSNRLDDRCGRRQMLSTRAVLAAAFSVLDSVLVN
jgi:hypothetical protein